MRLVLLRSRDIERTTEGFVLSGLRILLLREESILGRLTCWRLYTKGEGGRSWQALREGLSSLLLLRLTCKLKEGISLILLAWLILVWLA